MLARRTTLRTGGIVLGLVLLLGSSARADRPRATAAEIDLGTRTLGHGEVAVGPLHAAVGLWDRVMAGTYVAPWSVALIDGLSVVPNGFAKVDLGSYRRLSLSVQSALFYAKLDDLDEDGLNARAVIWPTQVGLGFQWSRRWASTLEATGVMARATADKRRDQDTEIYGVALATTFHVGWVQRFQWTRRFGLWARARLVLEHAPIQVDARAALSDSTRLRVRARANSAELSSVGSVMAGFVWTWRGANVRLGLGYGHWILPWVLLPVGRSLPTGDLSLYWRF